MTVIAPESAAVEAVGRYGRSALAWEVLRRDPAYWAAYRQLGPVAARPTTASADFVARWGLHFR